MRRSPSLARSNSLHSASVATLLVAALTLWGCGGGGGGGTGGEGGGLGGAGGAAKGGTSGGGATGKGGAAGGTVTGNGGAAGGTVTGNGGAAGGTVTGTGGTAGAAGGTVTGTGGAAGGTVTGNGGAGGAAGGTVTGNGGVGGAVGGAAGSGTTCTNGASCTTSGGVTGICSGGTCEGCSASPACVTAYGSGHVCLTSSGNCVAGNCATNGDCNGKICGSNHTCGVCAATSDCTTAYGTGYICQTSSGTCIQGNCTANSECGTGQICSGNSCVSCGTTDSACVTGYGTGYICVSGNCVMGSCHSGAQCGNGQICNSSHACANCTDDTGCQASYTDGRICDTTSGACIVGNCHDNTNCSNGQVCVGNACVNCTSNGQCGSGKVCLPSGACTAGDCLAAADCNDATKVCASNHCGACTATSDCTAAYGTNHVCNNGACTAGNCTTNAECAASGQICGSVTALNCGTCGTGTAGDTACFNAFGAGHICNSGVCVTGTCHDSTGCNAGQVCNLTTHTCGGCGSGAAGDAICQGDTSRYNSTYICQGNACIIGNCHAAGDCNNVAQVCNSFTCGMCSATSDCTNAYGANHVCTGGQCVSGNCNTSSECGGNQLCINHACTACTAGPTGDAQCVADTSTYGAMHICLSGQCVAGDCHDTTTECTGGKICGISAAHMCGSCGSGTSGDAACVAAYTSGNICVAGACAQGDCHDTDTECPAGKICGVSSLHTCGNCDTGTAGDTECASDPHYTSADICFQGLCGAGNCHATSADCSGTNAGLICGVTLANTCGSCTSDSQCQSDPFYINDICNKTTGKCESNTCAPNNATCTDNTSDFCCGGSCVAGNCCVDTDCGAVGKACVGHTCSTCDAASNNTWFVDPVNGNDFTATGSGTASGASAPGCAFKTITVAISKMPATPFPGSKIVIIGASTGPATGLAAGDNLPIIIPTNTTLTTTGGPITVTLATTTVNNPAGFRLNNNASAISGGTGAPLVLAGAINAGVDVSGIAIQVSPGTTTFTSSVSNLTIQNTNGDGIRVAAGTLTVGGGVTVTGSNNDGIHITGGVANINNPSGAQTLFSNNAQHGIEVGTLGSVNVVGTPASPPSASGTVLAYQNTQAGIRINQTPGGVGLITNSINGLVTWANTNYGMRLFGGSLVKVRNSVMLGNGQYGVLVSSGANTVAGNDTSNIDLGKVAATDPGKNYLQSPLGASNNSQAGLCVNLTACTAGCLAGGPLTETISAEGNEMVSNTGNLQVDCSTATTVITKGNCASQHSDGIAVAAGITTIVDIAGCQ